MGSEACFLGITVDLRKIRHSRQSHLLQKRPRDLCSCSKCNSNLFLNQDLTLRTVWEAEAMLSSRKRYSTSTTLSMDDPCMY